MADHKINDIPFDKEAWDACFADGQIIKSEIVALLDTDGDQRLEVDDLRWMDPRTFGSINDILKKHGFSIGKTVAYDFYTKNIMKGAFATFDAERLIEMDKRYRGIPSFLLQDRDFVMTAASLDRKAIIYADISLRSDKDFFVEIVKKNGSALLHADESLKNNKDVVLAAVSDNGLALQYACESLKGDKEIALAAMRENPMAFKHTSSALKSDREIVMEAIRMDGDLLSYADPSLTTDEDFMLDAFCENMNTKELTIPKNELWKRAIKRYGGFSGLNIPDDVLYDLDSFKKYVGKRYNIDFISRIHSIPALFETLRIRESVFDPDDPRPLAVVIYPKIDRNNAFASYPAVDRLQELGFRVVYFEAGSEDAAERYLFEATGGGKKKARLIFLGGHGKPDSLMLGAGLASKGMMIDLESGLIDTGDFAEGNLDIDLPQYIDPEGDLVLDSCLNGEGGSKNPENLANTIGNIMPQGVRIHSSTMSMNIKSIDLSLEGNILMTWTVDSLYVRNGSKH